MIDFFEVEIYLPAAKAIAWDTCHKIYVLLDDEQVVKMREYGYGDENDPDSLITKSQMNSDQMLETIKRWYADSCNLRFVQAIATVPEGTDPNEGFTVLIEQFPQEECEDCGEYDCQGVCNDEMDTEDEDEDEDEQISLAT